MFNMKQFLTENKLTEASRLDESPSDPGVERLAEQFAYDLNSVLRKHNIVKTEMIKGHMVFVNSDKDFLLVKFNGGKAVSANIGKRK